MTMPELCSWDDLKNILELEETTIGAYPALEDTRLRVAYALESHLGRFFEVKERTENITVGATTATKLIYLPGIPVASIASVTVQSRYETLTLTEDDYMVVNYGLKLWGGVRDCVVTVVYTGGLATVLGSFARASLIQTVYEYQGKENMGSTSVSTDGGSVTTPEIQLLKTVKAAVKGEYHPLQW